MTFTPDELAEAVANNELLRVAVAIRDDLPEELRLTVHAAVTALAEEAVQAHLDGKAIVWLVARVPDDTGAEVAQELVRRAGAVLAELNTHPDIGDGPPPGPDDPMADVYRRGWAAGAGEGYEGREREAYRQGWAAAKADG